MIKEYMRSYSNNNKTISLLVLLSILLITLIPTQTNAVGVGVNYTGSWVKEQEFKCPGVSFASCDFKAKADFKISLSKNFDLSSSTLGNLNQNEWRVIRPNESITATNHSVTGSYSYSFGDRRTPPLDGIVYKETTTSAAGYYGTTFDVRSEIKGGISSQLGYRLTSSDNSVIDCSAGSSCTARDKDGTATITVSFPGKGSYYLERSFEWGWELDSGESIPAIRTQSSNPKSGSTTSNSCPDSRLTLVGSFSNPSCKNNSSNQIWVKKGEGKWNGAWNYTLNTISYNVRVERPNQPPVVSNVNTNNISYNTATVNWAFTDPDRGDYQTDVEVRVLYASNNKRADTESATGANIRSFNIDGLRPGTTYYPQVIAKDSKGAPSGWVNGPQFTTDANNPPDLSTLSCKGITLGEPNYTSAKLEWDYTGKDEPGDQLIVEARWRIDPNEPTPNESIYNNAKEWKIINLGSARSGSADMTELISGYKYQLQISLNDNRNSHLGDRWKGCRTVTPENYPNPNVQFSLSRGTNIKSIGETLEIETGNSVSASWEITNSNGFPETGVEGNSCRLITTNTGGGVNADIFSSGTNRGLTGSNIVGQNLPVSLVDQEYNIELNCKGKPAKDKRDISESIKLVVQTYPVVSCRIDGKTTVKEGDTSININANANVRNVLDEYKWIARVNKDNTSDGQIGGTKISPQNPDTLNISLDYSGIAFGKYNPWIQVTKTVGGAARSRAATCGTVSNLGSSTIREVNP
jgi:hypothetical protein